MADTNQPKRTWVEPFLVFLGTIFVLIVGSVTGYLSWGHIVHVGVSVSEPGAQLLPVCIDGMMLSGTVYGAVDRLRGMKTRGWAVFGLWFGSALTLGINMLSAYERGIWAMGIAMLSAVTFLTSVEMVFHPSRTPLDAIKRKVTKATTDTFDPVPAQPQAPVVESTTAKASGSTPGTRGRRPGPQVPPEGRRVHKRARGTVGGGGTTTTAPKPAQITAVTKKVTEAAGPLAMDGSLADLVGTAAAPEASGDQDKVVS